MSDHRPDRAAAELAARHPEIARAREKHGAPFTGQRPEPSQRFALLVRSIVGQQISVVAADAILARVLDVLANTVSPQALMDAEAGDLRAAGLSGAKVRTLRALSESCEAGDLDLAAADTKGEQEIRDDLCAIVGIGPWTADMFLMFGLRLPDIWPVGDVAMRRGCALLQGLSDIPDAAGVAPLGEVYRPYRSVAAWYCWAEIDADPQGSAWN